MKPQKINKSIITYMKFLLGMKEEGKDRAAICKFDVIVENYVCKSAIISIRPSAFLHNIYANFSQGALLELQKRDIFSAL